uniref:PilZ domain-containing protein n=1 Tax=uncultured bacterium fosmid pJB39A3 TaxID=1478063 RepID=A0A0H3U7P6_9BACT|nr:hypothetical protein [uncultured bacterium fosmid pJB39A3]
MAGEINLKRGAKIYMAYDVELGKQPDFNMLVTFKGNLDASTFLVSIPMTKDGEEIPLNENKKLLMRFGQGAVQSLVAGYADDIVKDGIHSYWKMRRVTEFRQFFKRVDERVKLNMFMEFTMDSWKELADGTTEHAKGYTLDISYSGAAIYENYRFNVGDVCEVFMPGMGVGPGSDPINYLKATVCWVREAPQGSPFKLLTGLQYKFDDEIAKERMKLYVVHARHYLEATEKKQELDI